MTSTSVITQMFRHIFSVFFHSSRLQRNTVVYELGSFLKSRLRLASCNLYLRTTAVVADKVRILAYVIARSAVRGSAVKWFQSSQSRANGMFWKG